MEKIHFIKEISSFCELDLFHNLKKQREYFEKIKNKYADIGNSFMYLVGNRLTIIKDYKDSNSIIHKNIAKMSSDFFNKKESGLIDLIFVQLKDLFEFEKKSVGIILFSKKYQENDFVEKFSNKYQINKLNF